MVKRFLLSIVMLLCVAEIASAGLITDIERFNPDNNSSDTAPVIAGPLVEDAPTFVDRDHSYKQIPAYLIGADYVMVANDDKDNWGYALDIVVTCPANLYLFIDNRTGRYETAGWPEMVPDILAAGMSWVASMGFVDTGDNLGIDEHGDGSINSWSSIFVLRGVDGVVTLHQQNDAINPNWRNMYGVAVTPEPTTLALLGLGGLILRRR